MPPQAYTGQCMQIRQRALLVDELEKVSLRVGFRGVWSGAGLEEQRALTCSPGPTQLGAGSTCGAPRVVTLHLAHHGRQVSTSKLGGQRCR